MVSFQVVRIAALAAAAFSAAACSKTAGPATGADSLPPAIAAAEAEGPVPDYCPRISLREGTAVLRKQSGEDLEYIASIIDTTRECHVLNGELKMKIGIAGKLVPGPAAKGGSVGLPIRIAIVRGADLIYSKVGIQNVPLGQGAAGQTFVYVDEAIAFPEPKEKNIVIYAGYDEGEPKTDVKKPGRKK